MTCAQILNSVQFKSSKEIMRKRPLQTGHNRLVLDFVGKNGKVSSQLGDKLWLNNKYEKCQSASDPVVDCIC